MPGLTALVPLDGTKLSESAFALLPFVKKLGFETVVLLSIWESEWDADEAIPGHDKGELNEVAEKGRAYLGAYLSSQAEHVRSLGLATETVVRIGRAGEETLEYINGSRIDLVIIATHGRSGIARWRLGSVADNIIRNAPCPAIVIGPNVDVELTPYALKRVVVPLDGAALAEQAVPVAAWVARTVGAEIDLIRAVSVTAVSYDEGYGAYPLDLLGAMEAAGKTYLDRIAATIGDNVRTALLVGGAGDQILDYLQENPAGLVVMTAHGHAGVRRFVLGSVTDRVLHGPAPVMVLRPEAEAKGALVEAAKGAG